MHFSDTVPLFLAEPIIVPSVRFAHMTEVDAILADE